MDSLILNTTLNNEILTQKEVEELYDPNRDYEAAAIDSNMRYYSDEYRVGVITSISIFIIIGIFITIFIRRRLMNRARKNQTETPSEHVE